MSHGANCRQEIPGSAKSYVNWCAPVEMVASTTPPLPASGYVAPCPLADLIRGSRLVAGIIDYTIVGVVTTILSMIFGVRWVRIGFMTGDFLTRTDWMTGIWGIVGVMWLLGLIYFTYFEGTSGQTFGKEFTHIKVIKENGTKCDFGSALVRNILRIVDHLPFLYILGIILIAATEKKQRLGDMLAKTIVVKA